MPSPAPDPDADLVRRLAARRDLLAALEERPRRVGDLAATLDPSRSTLDRRLTDLAVLGLVERTDDAYRLTLAGRAALVRLDRLADRFETIDGARAVIASIPPDAPFSFDVLEGATVCTPDPHAPNELFEPLVDGLEHARRYREFSGAERLPRLRRLIHERSVDDDLEAEVILTEDLAAFAVETRPEVVAETMRRGGVDVYTIPSLPYRLSVVETPARSDVFVVAYGDGVDVTGVVRNDSEAAAEWADRTFRRVREEATPLDPPPLPE